MSYIIKKRTVNPLLSRCSILLLCVVMLHSLRPYFLWQQSVLVYGLILLFINLRLCFFSKGIKRSSLILAGICILNFIILDVPHLTEAKTYAQFIFRHCLLISLVILMTIEEKARIISYITKIYATVLLLSMIAYILFLFGLEFPYNLIKHPEEFYPEFRNYIFFIVPQKFFSYRFQSLFLEPGHVGMISALMLYTLRYNFRSIISWILLISIFMSLSLAAYVLLVIGLVLYHFILSENKVKFIFKSLLILGGVIWGCLIIDSFYPDSIFSELIFDRFEYDEDKGISGNNRTDYSFDRYYEKQFWADQSCLFGIGSNFIQLFPSGGNSSYKVFIVSHGIVGIISLICFFFSFVYTSRSKYVLVLFILYAVSFLQRPYALWEIQSVVFISTVAINLERKINA